MVSIKVENGVKVAYLIPGEPVHPRINKKRVETEALEGAVDLCESLADAKRAHPDLDLARNLRNYNMYSDFWF